MALLKSLLSKVKSGLSKTRETFVGGLKSMLLGKALSDELIDDLEAKLIQADVGVKTTTRLIDGIREAHKSGEMTRGDDVLAYLKAELKRLWPDSDRRLHFADTRPTVILVAGINGAGKTTSIAKLAKSLGDDGQTVLLGACDTFRAGAVRQLEIWANRLGVDIVKGQEGGDPAAVAFDACQAAIARGVDVLLLDTAGRLHTQDPLMRQLTKIRDVTSRQIGGAPHEVMLVLDATAGQNGLRQAMEFQRAIDVTGLFLAKLDGTAKGGIVIAIREQTDIPVKFVGLGETLDDVQPFDPDTFIEAMFEE
ncbi:MAG: signal recognition particle-docking protein FtsY [Phycisphaerales bacterium]|nr:signal recognition particle-docking protein FtsY [Phycisphaerales bacterium]